ncbi:MAG: hypothetical protein R3F59_14405 [Myxococcota bacterium]
MAVVLAVGGALTLRAGGGRPAGREAAWTLLACGWPPGWWRRGCGPFVAVAQPGW